MKLLFFDYSGDIVKEYQKVLSNLNLPSSIQIEYITIDVKDLVKDYPIDYIVSPANSYGIMDGGIDEIYMELFPSIQEDVQAKISTFNHRTAYGRYMLPVGSTCSVSIRRSQDDSLALSLTDMICAPTMKIPTNIKGFDNVYYSMLGILYLVCPDSKNVGDSDNIVAIPGLGTGVGGLDGNDSGVQIAFAIKDYLEGIPRYPKGTKITVAQDSYIVDIDYNKLKRLGRKIRD